MDRSNVLEHQKACQTCSQTVPCISEIYSSLMIGGFLVCIVCMCTFMDMDMSMFCPNVAVRVHTPNFGGYYNIDKFIATCKIVSMCLSLEWVFGRVGELILICIAWCENVNEHERKTTLNIINTISLELHVQIHISKPIH